MINALRLITAKRDGLALTREDIIALIEAYTHGRLPDYQMSAFLMASYLRGMNETETSALTESMLYSGVILDHSKIEDLKVDKHSTGGVGDKLSLIVAPLAAACGVCVPMITGRGLGHTGGTQDKLSAIPGFRTDLSIVEFKAQLERIGVVISAQTDEIAPADRNMYALRDVTVTVDFIPFIAASIMSKKLAEGLDALVIDVKVGRGAFMSTEKDARDLASLLVAIGERFGTATVAWMTRMDVPLGRAIGNWIEVRESIQCLRGEGDQDVMQLSLKLAAEMIHLAGCAGSVEDSRRQAVEALASGRAFEKFVAIVEAQGGDTSVILDPDAYGNTKPQAEIRAPASARGYVADIDALMLGITANQMGVGRSIKEEEVDPHAGIYLHTKPGEPVSGGTLLASLYTDKLREIPRFAAAVRGSFRFAEEPPEIRPLLMNRLSRRGWLYNAPATKAASFPAE